MSLIALIALAALQMNMVPTQTVYPRGQCLPSTTGSGPTDTTSCSLECGGYCFPGNAWNNFVPGKCDPADKICTLGRSTITLWVQYYTCNATTIGCEPGQSKCYFTPSGAPVPTLARGC